MILAMPFDRGSLVDFDSATGDALNHADTSKSPKGNFHRMDRRNLAIYCQDNDLFLQIDCDKWTLSSENIELTYSHNLAKKTTRFEIKSDDKPVSIEYEAWWADIPGFEPVEPEMDEDEDFLGYVFAVWKNKQLQLSLISSWS